MRYTCILILLFTIPAFSQIAVQVELFPDSGQHSISPFIYGTNGPVYQNGLARRMGGNRLTGYNWEHNASNAGADWFHSSDNYLTWISGIPAAQEDEPGIVLTDFHDQSVQNNQYSLLTLQMGGYVARDKRGTVDVGETAPSPRWREVVLRKGSAYQLQPDTSDGQVYLDEMLNFLIDRYGAAGSPNAVRGYSLDNEPALWTHTHPRILPSALNCADLFARSVDMAKMVKDMDAAAEVFGPALYGFNAFLTLQDAPDWSNYSGTYDRFVDAYLAEMKAASDLDGRRLLDVLDVHWYPEPAGVYSGDTSRAVAETRMQLARSLWDSTYVEDSWIGTWFSPVALLPGLQHSIDQHFPGTKLAITEYDYGASNHISGGIAQVEAFGAFGRQGVYWAAKWGDFSDYIENAYHLFRNYDGQGGSFGDTGFAVAQNAFESVSIYAAFESDEPDRLHVVACNKDYEQIGNLDIQINAQSFYTEAEIWYFDRSSSAIRQAPGISGIGGNTFTYSLPPLSVYHFVLQSSPTGVAAVPDERSKSDLSLDVFPNPANPSSRVSWNLGALTGGKLQIFDITGRLVRKIDLLESSGSLLLDNRGLASGTYFILLQGGRQRLIRKLLVVK